jgi:hypothetical protein
MARATILIFSGIFWVALFSIFWATNSISHEGGPNSHEGGFSERSKQHLAEIHIDLYEVVFLARLLSEVPFEITDGMRTIEEQRHYYETGRSQTMNSKHLTDTPIVWGGDWRTFKDYPHFELKERPDGH